MPRKRRLLGRRLGSSRPGPALQTPQKAEPLPGARKNKQMRACGEKGLETPSRTAGPLLSCVVSDSG